jgi:hypothetical protein
MSVQLQSGALLPLFHSRGPACHDFGRTGGRAEELAIMTKVYCSETAVDTIYDCVRVVGVASYQGPGHAGTDHARRRKLHDIVRQPGYDSLRARRSRGGTARERAGLTGGAPGSGDVAGPRAGRTGCAGTIWTAMPAPATSAAPSSCAGVGSWPSIMAASSVVARGSLSDSTAVRVAPMRRSPARNSRGGRAG